MQLETLQKDMIAAMKAKDKERKDSISSLIGAIKKVAIDEKVRENIPEELVDRVILKEMKSVKEQIDTCPADRTELLAAYKARYAVFEEYAPKMLSAEEVKAIIMEKFADVVATKNKGMIMKNVMGELKGKADGKVINQIVAELCQQKILFENRILEMKLKSTFLKMGMCFVFCRNSFYFPILGKKIELEIGLEPTTY